jgi:hypothetical protein
MCWYIVETKDGSVALDGEMTAHAFHDGMKRSLVWVAPPRKADPNDAVDRVAVVSAQARIDRRHDAFASLVATQH